MWPQLNLFDFVPQDEVDVTQFVKWGDRTACRVSKSGELYRGKEQSMRAPRDESSF